MGSSQRPGDRLFRLIGAQNPCPYGTAQVVAQAGVGLLDPGDGVADPGCDRGTGAQLGGQGLLLRDGTGGALGITVRVRDLFLQLGEAPPVSMTCLDIEDFTEVAHFVEILGPRCPPTRRAPGCGKVEGGDGTPWLGEETGQILQALGVPKPYLSPGIGQRPHLALTAEFRRRLGARRSGRHRPHGEQGHRAVPDRLQIQLVGGLTGPNTTTAPPITTVSSA
jgi:hypothetical protein